MMKKRFVLFLLLLSGFSLSAQDVQNAIPLGAQKKFKPYFTAGAGMSWAVINNRKEVKGKYKPGLNANLAFYSSPWFALSADFNSFFNHDASPSFENISSWNTELNGNLIMGVGQTNLKFKAIFGLSYLSWRATFIGPTLNDQSKFYYGMPLHQQWIAGNLGCGVSQNIGTYFIASFDFRTRFTSEKRDLIGVSDTAFLLGCAWQIHGGKDRENEKENSAKRKTTNGKSGRQYKWLKKRM